MAQIFAIGLAYGHRGQPIGKKPVGLTNEDLAKLIARDYIMLSYISVQHEIGTELNEVHHILPHFQIREHRKKGLYLNTLEGLEQIVADWQRRMFDLKSAEIWVYCHEDHVSGIRMMLRKLGLRPSRYITTDVYDPSSAQWWTRNKLFAWIEKIRRGFGYLLRGEIDLRGLIKNT